ncbi:hypothetical protein [Nocardiopsis ganjiahuensis]|uniref:hypothetical protein n=1 Tax=Nocardiopsis ganjiahuensis TaxID=239984 RepID=UPI0003751E95|nr:hypothetical protein [Nocardiopsis ganjiahuensis]
MRARMTVRPGADIPEPTAPPTRQEIQDRIDFKSKSGWFFWIASASAFFAVIALPPAAPVIIVLLVALIILMFRWYFRPKSQMELRNKQLRLLAEAAGRDYVTYEMLTGQDQSLLGQAQRAVDAVLDSPLHRSGQLLDTTRNSVVLHDLEWQIASDLLKASDATVGLLRIGAPRSEQEQANLAHRRAVQAVDKLRSEADRRVQAIRGYAGRVHKAQLLLDDLGRVGEYDRIADELLAESAGGRQQDAALASLVDAQKDALRIARIHDDLVL